MKKLFVLSAVLFLLCFNKNGYAQAVQVRPAEGLSLPDRNAKPDTTKPSFTKVYLMVDEVPQFKGGTNGWFKYLGKNTIYPKQAKRKNIQGQVIVSFVVERDGKLTHIKIARKLFPRLDAEALRLVHDSPKWIPGKEHGYRVRTAYSVPINFELK